MYSQSQLHTTLFARKKSLFYGWWAATKKWSALTGISHERALPFVTAHNFSYFEVKEVKRGFWSLFSFRKHKAKIKLAMSLFLLGVLSHFKSDPKEVTQFWAGGHGITARKFHGDLTISLMKLIASTDALTSIRSPTICDSSQFFKRWIGVSGPFFIQEGQDKNKVSHESLYTRCSISTQFWPKGGFMEIWQCHWWN